MNKLRKFIIGALLTIALIGIGTKVANKKEEYKQPTKEVSLDNPQEQLDKAYQISKPSNITEIIYDPEFNETDRYIRGKMRNYFPEEDILKAIQNARKVSPGHNMGVQGIFRYMGDGEKRPVFARKELLTSPNVMTIEDIASATDHEDVHAGEERYGLDFYDHRKKGEEFLTLLKSGKIRTEMMLAIGELGAHAYQLNKIQRGERKTSRQLKEHVERWFVYLKGMVETEKAQGILQPVEQEFYEAKRKRYDSVFKKL